MNGRPHTALDSGTLKSPRKAPPKVSEHYFSRHLFCQSQPFLGAGWSLGAQQKSIVGETPAGSKRKPVRSDIGNHNPAVSCVLGHGGAKKTNCASTEHQARQSRLRGSLADGVDGHGQRLEEGAVDKGQGVWESVESIR